MTDDTKIADRVRKLFALAERAGTPEEAATAFALAQKLIAQHALTEEQIRQAQIRERGGVAADEPIRASVVWTAGGSFPTWIGMLVGALAEANGCVAVLWRTSSGSVARVWGRDADREVVAEMLRLVVGQIDAAAAACKEARGRSGKNNFRLGATQVVTQRVREAAAEARKALEASAREQDAQAPAGVGAAEVTALALRALDSRGDRAKAARDLECPNLRTTRNVRRSSYDMEARAAGRAAGERVRLKSSPALGGS